MKTNMVYNMDCLEGMKMIPDKSIDMILCDLPYGTTQCRWDSIIPFNTLWEQYKRIIKDNGAIVLFGKNPFSSQLISSNLKLYKYDWVIEKTSATGHLNAKIMPMQAHELAHVFYKKQPVYNAQKTYGHERKVSSAEHKRNSKKTECYGEHGLSSYDSTERYPRTVLKLKWDKQKSAIHSTQKPVSLCEYFIKTYTNKGETVLDNCMGSFTTAVACIETGRNFIGFENDKDIFDKGVERLWAHAKQKSKTQFDWAYRT